MLAICLFFGQANVEETAVLASKHTDLPPHVLKELATKSATVTPWWWGLKTLIKVRETCAGVYTHFCLCPQRQLASWSQLRAWS